MIQQIERQQSVILVGPSPDSVGGMSAVVGQMLRLDFGAAYRVQLFANTAAVDANEPLWRRIGRHLRHVGQFRRMICRSGSRIVHIHTCSGFSFYRAGLDMAVARSENCRTVLHIHGAQFDEFFEAEPPYRRRLIRWCLGGADRVIALSAGWEEKLRRMAPHARISVVENAVELPAGLCDRDFAGRVRFVVLARMDEWKGIEDVLAACVRLRHDGVSFELVLAGPPGTAGDAVSLPRKIKAMGLGSCVRYLGPVHGQEKAALLRDCDVYVQGSHNEGLPISLLEALAYRMPVVATRVGAVPEVITDGEEGLLVPVRRPECLASAMRTLVEDGAKRRRMSSAAGTLAQRRFGVCRFRDDLLDLYQTLDAARDSGFVRRGRSACVNPGAPVDRGALAEAL